MEVILNYHLQLAAFMYSYMYYLITVKVIIIHKKLLL